MGAVCTWHVPSWVPDRMGDALWVVARRGVPRMRFEDMFLLLFVIVELFVPATLAGLILLGTVS